MNIAIAMTLGALWRYVDGHGYGPTWARSIACAAIAMLAAWIGVGASWLALWLAAWASINIIVGHTDWKDWMWQPMRFGWCGAFVVLPIGPAAWPYVAACAMAGLAYPLLFWIDERMSLPKWERIGLDGPEAWARLPAGALILGGLAIL